MKFSSKVEKCGLSPMRKFHPYAVAAKARGVNVYHLTREVQSRNGFCAHLARRKLADCDAAARYDRLIDRRETHRRVRKIGERLKQSAALGF